MSSSTLTTIQNEINRYSYPVLMAIGNIGNILIVILFYQHRQNACSMYLITSAIINNLYLMLNGFIKIFSLFNDDDGTVRALISCKMNNYLIYVLGQVAKTMLIMACIDRYMITHERVGYRAFSTPKRAKYLIFFSIIFWMIINIHVLIFPTIINGQCSRPGIYGIFYSVYTIIVVGLLPSFTLSIFGCLTYRNLRRIHNRLQPMGAERNNSIQRKDRDLLIIVISEVLVYILTTTLFPLILVEMMISQYVIARKSFQYIQIEFFVFQIGVLLLCINSAAPFYTYLISSKSFRRDFKQLMMKIYQKLRPRTSAHVVPTKNQMIARQDTGV